MGMAAGQARLLSITTRMSDNELRAQLINNDKMRLATKSAQVSEAYTTALNEAQMMFTNYDSENKTSYQELTYNALTSYNPYNNQYAISNASGQVLVSEKDATNYKNADGDLNKFLASYGLEYTTDYFNSTIKTNISEDSLKYKAGIDENGESIYGIIQFDKDSDSALGVNGKGLEEVLQNMYTGVEGDDIHKGYDIIKSSKEYLDYSGKLATYTSSMENMLKVITENMKTELYGMKSGDITFANIEEALKKDKSIYTVDTASKYLEALSNIIGDKTEGTGMYAYATDDGKDTLDELSNLLDKNTGATTKSDMANEDYSIKRTNSTTGSEELTVTVASDDGNYGIKFKHNSGSSYTMTMPNGKEGEEAEYINISSTASTDGNVVFKYYSNDETGEIASSKPADGEWTEQTTSIPTSLFTDSNWGTDGTWKDKNSNPLSKIIETEPNTVENIQQIGLQVFDALTNGITNIWDFAASDGSGAYSKFTKTGTDTVLFETFKNATLDLYNYMTGATETTLPTKSDTEAKKKFFFNNMLKLDDMNVLKELVETSGSEDSTDKDGNKILGTKSIFQKIYDVYILDCVMDTYGEPKFTWIDKNDKNGNGETKAQWYTNLFNRMKSGGYKTLQDGLASSAEWIKFAFESGLVTLEQVDGSNTWNSTTYSNCSDITEQTNNTAVTIAEAEYTAQMNKIQNKDKMYDLELKNIDTEHNSLQTEYESIKNAVDKNIERTFKIYS